MKILSKRGICAGVLAVIFALCVALGVCFMLPASTSAYAADGEMAEQVQSHNSSGSHSSDNESIGWTALSSVSDITSSGATIGSSGSTAYYYLSGDLSIGGTITVHGTVVLCLNGKMLRFTESSGSVITINTNATLYLCDCSSTSQSANTYCFSVNESGQYTYCCNSTGEGACENCNGEDGCTDACETCNCAGECTSCEAITGGVITGGSGTGTSSTTYGGCVNVANGTFNMYGGTIAGNTAYYGGGVSVETGTFNMYGGTIVGNTATYGGGVNNDTGTFNMYGGTIAGNTASYGGAVSVQRLGGFFLYAGSITKNSTTDNDNGGGGGLYIEGHTTIYGGEITNNTTVRRGGNVYLGGTLTMYGGLISGGTSSKESDGYKYTNVYLWNGTAGLYLFDGTLEGDITNAALSIFGASGNCVYVYGGTITGSIINTSGNSWSNGYVYAGRFSKDLSSSALNVADGYTAVSVGDSEYIVVPSTHECACCESNNTQFTNFLYAGGCVSSTTTDADSETNSEKTKTTGDTPTLSDSTLTISTEGNYCLVDNVNYNISVTGNATVHLCLNGYMLTGTGSSSTITVEAGSTLYICDCNSLGLTHEYYIDADGLYVFDMGTSYGRTGATISGGVVIGGVTVEGADSSGSGGTLYMCGGTVVGGTANSGSSVSVGTNGAFMMSGGYLSGSISGNGTIQLTGGYFDETAFNSATDSDYFDEGCGFVYARGTAGYDSNFPYTIGTVDSADVEDEDVHTHSYEWHTNSSSHVSVCTGCSQMRSDSFDEHVYDNDEDLTCNTCGYTRTLAEGGTVEGGTAGDTCEEHQPEWIYSAEGHVQICLVCGAVIDDSYGSHTMSSWSDNGDGTHSQYCEEGCGYAVTATHSDADGDNECDDCGASIGDGATGGDTTKTSSYDIVHYIIWAVIAFEVVVGVMVAIIVIIRKRSKK